MAIVTQVHRYPIIMINIKLRELNNKNLKYSVVIIVLIKSSEEV